jgi:hypothetical protein
VDIASIGSRFGLCGDVLVSLAIVLVRGGEKIHESWAKMQDSSNVVARGEKSFVSKILLSIVFFLLTEQILHTDQ